MQGLVSVTAGVIALSARMCFTVFVTQRHKAGRVPATATQAERNPQLVSGRCALLHLLDSTLTAPRCVQIGLVLLCTCLLALRGSVGTVALYPEHRFSKLWLNEKYYYSLCEAPPSAGCLLPAAAHAKCVLKLFWPAAPLPEFIVLSIQLFPFTYARMGQAWPRATGGAAQDDAGPQKELQLEAQQPHDQHSNGSA